MLDDRTDALFPLPQSAAGKLLAHLVTRQIPGTPIETTPAELAHDAGLRPAEAATALTKLSDDGLILIEPEPDRDAAVITVLLAPPLDEYGIEPQWSESGAPAAIPATSVAAPDNPGANGTGEPARSRPRGRSMADQAGNEQASAGTPPPAATSANGSTQHTVRAAGAAGEAEAPPARRPEGRRRTAGAPPRGRRAEPVAAAQPLPLVEEDKGKAAATGEERDQGANAGQHPGRGSGRRAAEAASVDETALVRGFVERFERLLAEIDELKRRAQSAEERVATTEKLLRSAERRAETAETRLAEAQERLRTWAELTRRMQQLSRQADGGSRGRAGSSTRPAARDGTAARGQAESGPA